MKKNTLSIILILSLLIIPFITKAQTSNSNLILSWEAQNFYPSNYEGKGLITKGTEVLVSATAVLNNQIINLSNADFLWYLDGKLLRNETGAQEIMFKTNKNAKDSHFVRVLVTVGDNSLEGAIKIPVVKPLSVVNLSNEEEIINENNPITLTSTPYFFNIDSLNSLSFFWEVNGIIQEKKERSIIINSNNEYLQSGQNVIRSIISNESNFLETARSTKTINI